MSNIAERLRARRTHQPPTATELSQVPTLPNPHQLESGNQQTTQSLQQTDDTDFAGLTLEERTVRFFTVITEGLPMVGDNPLLRALMHRLGPLLVKELQGLSRDELNRVYQGMFVALGQVYQPAAAAIIIDLRQQHVLTQEVEIAVGALPEVAEDEGMTEYPALPIATELAPPPPAPPLPTYSDEDDVVVGVEVPDGDGGTKVIAMRISERDALMRRAAG